MASSSVAGVAWREMMQCSGWHRRPSPLAAAGALGAAAAIILALTAAGLQSSRGGHPVLRRPEGLTLTPPAAANPDPAPTSPANPSRAPTSRVSAGPAATSPANPGPAATASPTDRPASAAGPTTPTSAADEPPSTAPPPGLSFPDDAPPPDPAERAAAAFAVGYLTFHWSDDADGLRLRCRPWDTDELDATLAEPGVPPDRARRTAARETDEVAIRAVDRQDRATDHLDASVVAAVTMTSQTVTARTDTEVIDVRVVATSAGWFVAQVSG